MTRARVDDNVMGRSCVFGGDFARINFSESLRGVAGGSRATSSGGAGGSNTDSSTYRSLW